MNRKDIANLNNIMTRILTEAVGSDVEIKRVDFTPEEAEAKYEEADAHPYLYTTGDGKPVVLFFLQQHSDTEAWLHRSDGPAIVIEEGGPGLVRQRLRAQHAMSKCLEIEHSSAHAQGALGVPAGKA